MSPADSSGPGTIVVGVDRSMSSHHAARWAVGLPGALVSRVGLAHVLPPDAATERIPTWLPSSPP